MADDSTESLNRGSSPDRPPDRPPNRFSEWGGAEHDAPVLGDEPTRVRASIPEASPVESRISDSALQLFGERLEHYELLDCIGMGGMGRVFRARDHRLDRLVALKLLAPDLEQDTEIVKRFVQEAKAAARLDNPHFARVYYFGESKGHHFIAMEYVEGENVRKMILRQGRLHFAEALRITYQVALGLVHAADRGVVHRDIKPSNIILTPQGTAKLVDMGLARDFLQREGTSQDITKAGAILGTFDYVSPEQAWDPRQVDVRSDIYSLGCTLYHALTGEPPYPEGNPFKKLVQHQNEEVPDPRRLVPNLPDGLVRIVKRMMAKEAVHRHQTAGELVLDLIQLAEQLGILLVEPREIPDVRVVTEPEPFWQRQLSWAVPLVLLLVLLWGQSLWQERNEIALPSPAAAIVAQTRPSTPEEAQRERQEEVRNTRMTNDPRPDGSVGTIEVGPEADLRKEIAAAPPGTVLWLRGDRYDLSMEGLEPATAGLLLDKNLTLMGRSSTGPTTIRLSGGDRRMGVLAPGFALLTIRADECRLERLVLDPVPTGEGSRPIPALRVERGKVLLRQSAVRSVPATAALASPAIVLSGSSNDVADVSLEECYLAGGAEAIQLNSLGEVSLRLADVALGAYMRPFVTTTSAKVYFDFQHVTVLIAGGPVFNLARVDTARFQIRASVFAHLARFNTAAPLIDVRKDYEGPATLNWQGRDNLFHGFDRLLIEGRSRDLMQIDFRAAQRIGLIESGSSLNEPTWPLVDSDPDLAGWSDPVLQDPLIGFRLTPEARKRSLDGAPVGLVQGPWGRIYAEQSIEVVEPNLPLAVPVPTVGPSGSVGSGGTGSSGKGPAGTGLGEGGREIVRVDPVAEIFGRRDGPVFTHLRSACEETPTGRTIELAGPIVATEPIELTDKELIIRGANGKRPTIRVLASANGACRLWTLTGGAAITLRDLDIVVEGPRNLDASPSELFACEPGCRVELDRVVIQVGRTRPAAQVSVVRIQARERPGFRLANLFKPPNDVASTIRLSGCVVRSKGSLLSAEPDRHWTLEADQSILAFEQPMIQVAGKAEFPEPNGQNRMMLDRCTVLLGDSLVTMDTEATRPRTLFIETNGTFFVGLDPTNTFTRAMGTLAGDAWKDLLAWSGTGNVIAGYTSLLRYPTEDRGLLMGRSQATLGGMEWLKLHRDLPADSNVVTVERPADLRSIWSGEIPRVIDLPSNVIPLEPASQAGVTLSQLPPLSLQ